MGLPSSWASQAGRFRAWLRTAAGRLHPAAGPPPEAPHATRGFRCATWPLAHPEPVDMAVPCPRRLGDLAVWPLRLNVTFCDQFSSGSRARTVLGRPRRSCLKIGSQNRTLPLPESDNMDPRKPNMIASQSADMRLFGRGGAPHARYRLPALTGQAAAHPYHVMAASAVCGSCVARCSHTQRPKLGVSVASHGGPL